ncbi:MAG: flavin reductase family protein [Actinomycetota bacterium]
MIDATADATVDVTLFREIMSRLAAGVAIVTSTGADGAPQGLTATSVTSVSAEPPLVLVCVEHGSRTLAAIRSSRRFAVNLVHEAAEATAARFAAAHDDKFERSPWRPGRHGSPLLHEDTLAWAECVVDQEVEAGDHVIVIGRVEHGAVHAESRPPLTHFGRRFGGWAAR